MPSTALVPSTRIAARLWHLVDMTGPRRREYRLGACWMGGARAGLYWNVKVDGRTIYAHRAAWFAAYGWLPTDAWVLHRCDNRSCVRPSHLYLGTRADNTRDAWRRIRRERARRVA